jgi:hypothetical protein
MAERDTLRLIETQIIRIWSLAALTDLRRRQALYYASLGMTSEPEGRVTGTRQPDAVSHARAMRADEEAGDYARFLTRLEKALRRFGDKIAYDDNPDSAARDDRRRRE